MPGLTCAYGAEGGWGRGGRRGVGGPETAERLRNDCGMGWGPAGWRGGGAFDQLLCDVTCLDVVHRLPDAVASPLAAEACIKHMTQMPASSTLLVSVT
jgi:hypothetical protein